MEAVFQAVAVIMTGKALLLIIGGVLMGLVFGAIPGLTATLGVALLIPLTFALSPIDAMAALGAIYIGGISGGFISATLINMPGTPSSICTTFDAAPMARQGKAAEALSLGAFSSFVGGMISWGFLVAIAPQLASVAIVFGPYEYFLLGVFGIVVIIGLGGDSPARSFLGAVVGVLISMVGIDPVDGFERFTFGLDFLRGGFNLVPTLAGFFVVSEILLGIEDIRQIYVLPKQKISRLSLKGVFSNRKESIVNFVRSSLVGTFLGILPGIGGAIANFICYDLAKKFAKHPENFGKGEPQGIIASETGNNATTGGALIPMLTLGIPGDAVTAVMLGALMIHNVRPGPLLFKNSELFVNSFFVAILVANLVMIAVLWFGGIKYFVRALSIPRWFLFPAVLLMIIAGVWTLQYSAFDVWTAVVLGFVGYVLRKLKYPMSPLILGVILGPLIEDNLRRALVHSQGSYMPFLTRPYSLLILIVTIVCAAVSIWFYCSGLSKTVKAAPEQ
jgi:putative tricarboxylic transport membrane protein